MLCAFLHTLVLYVHTDEHRNPCRCCVRQRVLLHSPIHLYFVFEVEAVSTILWTETTSCRMCTMYEPLPVPSLLLQFPSQGKNSWRLNYESNIQLRFTNSEWRVYWDGKNVHPFLSYPSLSNDPVADANGVTLKVQKTTTYGGPLSNDPAILVLEGACPEASVLCGYDSVSNQDILNTLYFPVEPHQLMHNAPVFRNMPNDKGFVQMCSAVRGSNWFFPSDVSSEQMDTNLVRRRVFHCRREWSKW